MQRTHQLRSETASLVIYRRLLRYARPYLLIMMGAFIAMAVDAGSYAAFARLMEPLLDQSFAQLDGGLGAWMPFAIVGLVLVRSLAAFARLMEWRPWDAAWLEIYVGSYSPNTCCCLPDFLIIKAQVS